GGRGHALAVGRQGEGGHALVVPGELALLAGGLLLDRGGQHAGAQPDVGVVVALRGAAQGRQHVLAEHPELLRGAFSAVVVAEVVDQLQPRGRHLRRRRGGERERQQYTRDGERDGQAERGHLRTFQSLTVLS